MKSIELGGVRHAEQLVVGMNMEKTQVTLGLEAPAGIDDPHWLMYHADPVRARDLARTLLDAADIAEGKLADNGQYDANAAEFRENRG